MDAKSLSFVPAGGAIAYCPQHAPPHAQLTVLSADVEPFKTVIADLKGILGSDLTEDQVVEQLQNILSLKDLVSQTQSTSLHIRHQIQRLQETSTALSAQREQEPVHLEKIKNERSEFDDALTELQLRRADCNAELAEAQKQLGKASEDFRALNGKKPSTNSHAKIKHRDKLNTATQEKSRLQTLVDDLKKKLDAVDLEIARLNIYKKTLSQKTSSYESKRSDAAKKTLAIKIALANAETRLASAIANESNHLATLRAECDRFLDAVHSQNTEGQRNAVFEYFATCRLNLGVS